MSDLNPCPSCREPLDHPSGDGCANMTAHKERDMSDEELDALDAKLASQIGDDVSVIFNHEYLFKQSREAIADLRAQLSSATYGRDVTEACNRGLVRLNEETQARADRAEARETALREALTAERDQWISHAKNAIWADSEELKKAEAYAEELEKELNTCRMAQAVMDNTVADLEAKLASGVIAEYDDDSTVFLSGYAGGAAIGGAWSTLTLMEKASDGTLRVREYKAQGDWRATLVEIKAT